MDVFDLVATLRLDSSEYDKGLDKAHDNGNKFGNALKTAGAFGAAAVGAITTATVAMGTAIAKTTGETAAYGDNIDKMSQKLGLSAESYQKWDYVLGQAGASIDSMQTGLKTLTNKLDDAKNGSESAQQMFASLGLSLEDLNSMSREDIFEQVIYGFQGMADSTERAALANDIFGRSGQELTPLFNATTEETKELMNAASDLGFVMSDEAVKASADYQDALDTLQRTFSGLKRGLVTDFMPGITTVMDGLTALFAGDSDSGIEMITTGIDNVVSMIIDKMPQFIDLGMRILESLVQALIANLPKLLESGGKMVGQLVAGLVRAIPEIIAMTPQIVMAIVDGLAAAWPEIKQAGADLVQMIGQGIASLAAEAWSWGADLIHNFIEGIKAWAQNLWNTVSNIAQGVRNFLGFSEPKEGPLSNFHTYAPDMMKLFAQGIEDNKGMLLDTVADAFDFGDVTVNANNSPAAGGGAAGGSPMRIVVPVYLDKRQIGEAVAEYNREKARAFG